MKNIKLFLSTLVLFTTLNSFAQAGTLDDTFGNGGIVETYFNKLSSLSSVKVQPDGKILALGGIIDYSYNQIALVRYNADGTLDDSFGNAGKVISNFPEPQILVGSFILQPDGKILGAGYIRAGYAIYRSVIVRYNSNGTLDTAFGIAGTIVGIPNNDYNNFDQINSIALQSDGKIIASGVTGELQNHKFLLKRYLEDGAIDNDFGNNGTLITAIADDAYVTSSGITPDGKIVVSGYCKTIGAYNDIVLVQYLNSGLLDSSFGQNGILIIDSSAAGYDGVSKQLQIQADGKIVFDGILYIENSSASTTFVVERLHPNGVPDLDFGTNGRISIFPGPLDGSFSQSSKFSKILSDGKILVGGSALTGTGTHEHIAIYRYFNNGVLDPTFGNAGMVLTPISESSEAHSISIQDDGKIVVGGVAALNGGSYYPHMVVLRYNSGLELSTQSFNSDKNIFSVYPNPVNKTINLKFTSAQNQTLAIRLFDATGRKIKDFIENKEFKAGSNSETLEMPDSTSEGIYFLNIYNGKQVTTIKIIKQQ